MPPTSFYTIINGAAGGGRCRSRADQALGRLRAAGVELEVALTERSGHASELAAEAFRKGKRNFLAVGGDGTSYEVLNGLFPQAESGRVTLGALPLGTGNSFLRDFGIENEADALEALFRGRSRPVDVVRVEHADGTLYFINLLSIGFSAAVGAMTNRRLKPLGPAGYAVAVVARLVGLEPMRCRYRLDGGPIVDDAAVFLSFSNSKFTGGAMKMAPTADISDGKLDLIRAGKVSRTQLLRVFPLIYEGTHIRHPAVSEQKAKRIELIDSPEQDVLVDGEILRLRLRTLEVLPSALEVIA